MCFNLQWEIGASAKLKKRSKKKTATTGEEAKKVTSTTTETKTKVWVDMVDDFDFGGDERDDDEQSAQKAGHERVWELRTLLFFASLLVISHLLDLAHRCGPVRKLVKDDNDELQSREYHNKS